MKTSTKQTISAVASASPADAALACGSRLLRGRLQVTHVARRRFPAGWRTADSVVVTHRLILVHEGRLDYTVEGRRMRGEAGVQLLVPAWCRREWLTPARGSGCALLWCEFSSEQAALPPHLFFRRLAAGRQRIEAAALARILADRKLPPPTAAARLRSEGELKACLGRFFADAETPFAPAGGSPAASPRRHPEIADAVAWLEDHYTQPDALHRFYARPLNLSPNHFRLLFRAQTGGTVQRMLARLRLRKARYLVHETGLSMKEIAAASGFDDPLYFSHCYRRFWGAPPSADRHTAGVA